MDTPQTDGSDRSDTNQSDEIISTPSNKRTPTRLRVFLDAYANTGSVRQACEMADISPDTHYRKMKIDPMYREAVTEVEQRVGQLLEDVTVERAIDGDNALLLPLLKRFRPELYRERISAEVSGSIDLIERMKTADQRLIAIKRNETASGTVS